MNRSMKGRSSSRKRTSVKNDESMEPPPKVIRKSPVIIESPQDSAPGSPVVVKPAVTVGAKVVSPAPASPARSDQMTTPYSGNAPAAFGKIVNDQPATVTPPKSPPREDSIGEEDTVVERMELHETRVMSRLKDSGILSQLDCQVDLAEVKGSHGVITFRGTRKTVDTAKAMVSVLFSQKSVSTSEIKYGESIAARLIASALTSVSGFFHARTGPEGCVLGGWMRIAYALLFIVDRLLWSVELDFFFYKNGVLPPKVSRSYSYVKHDTLLTIFQLAPESEWLIWAVNYLCLLQGILLLLGVMPRFQVVCLVVYLASFEHLNDHVWDSQDVMLRMFGFLLCFMPLHRFTIYEWKNTRGMSEEEKKFLYENDSWPMWPFRLWQIEVCFIYCGAGLSKLAYKNWRNGLAVYYASFTNHFGGVFTPGFMFDRIGPLKAMSYGSLFVECVGWITVWPLATRLPSILAMVLLHVGIDISMNMHIFEWLSILGWMSFLVRPRRVQQIEKSGESTTDSSTSSSSRISRLLANIFIGLFIVVYGSETIPIYHIKSMTAEPLKPAVKALQSFMDSVSIIANPWEHRLGIHQETWSMFSSPVKKRERYSAFVTFRDGTKTKWHSPEWDEMNWLEKKRNRRRQLFYNNLMDFKLEGESDVGQKHLCEWIAQQYDKEVERVKLVYHWQGAKPPAENLTWFDEIDRTNVNTWNETHYILYTQGSCHEWVDEGECFTDPEFMLKRCTESCDGEFGKASEVHVGSHILVWHSEDSAFYSGVVSKIRENEKKQFYIKWDYSKFGEEWLDIHEYTFAFVGKDRFVSSHNKDSPQTSKVKKSESKEEL